MVMKAAAVRGLAHENFQSFLRQRDNVIILDAWQRGEQRQADRHGIHDLTGQVFSPRDQETTDEYKNLSKLSPTPIGGLIVTSLSQTLYVDGIRRAGSLDNMEAWDTWQANGWDAKQIPLHQAAIGHGLSFAKVLPGNNPLTGDRMAKMEAFSAKRMAAYFTDPNDEWPVFTIQADPITRPPTDDRAGMNEWTVVVTDEEADYFLSCENNGWELKDWTFISFEEHGMRVPPIVRYANRIDLDGRATGEIEANLPMLARIDQDTFDRLIVSRFGAWKVRYIAGMAKPSDTTDKVATAMQLKIEDLLVSTNPETKFGTLDATDIKGFLETTDHDLRMLAAVTQTPPHHLLGLSSNLQAEALTAATEGLMRKSGDFRMLNGRQHEQLFRLIAMVNRNAEEVRATDTQIRWRDTESRSLVQTANALALVATGLKVPVEMLWERIPGWTDTDTERAKKLVEDGTFDKLVAELEAESEAIKIKAAAEAAPAPSGNPTGGSNKGPK